VVKFPVESVNVQVIVVDSVIGRVVSLTPSIVPSHSSVAVGIVNSVISHSSVRSGKGSTSATGPVVSSIITCCVCVVKFPAESV
jgi:hypothetical protein